MSAGIILNQIRMPARLNTEQTAAVLGFQVHDITVLMRNKLLKPLGNPTSNAPKYFSAVDVDAKSRDINWLDRATKILSQHWQQRNRNRSSKQGYIT